MTAQLFMAQYFLDSDIFHDHAIMTLKLSQEIITGEHWLETPVRKEVVCLLAQRLETNTVLHTQHPLYKSLERPIYTSIICHDQVIWLGMCSNINVYYGYVNKKIIKMKKYLKNNLGSCYVTSNIYNILEKVNDPYKNFLPY